MITSIKKIKDVGVFKDFETRRTGLQKDFCKKNFVFGPNTYGKSTLCDILKDISDNSTERINKRLSIPNGAAQDVILNLSDGEGTVKLSNDSWNNNKLKNRIMVFDTEFMINNVFDGTKLIEDRTTKENFTEFILGDNGVTLAQEIEELKRELKEEKTKLSTMTPNSQKGESDATIKKYIRQEVQETLEELEEIKESLSKKIKNNEQREKNRAAIRDYKEIEGVKCCKLTKLISDVETIKDILGTSYSMTADTLVAFEKHIREVCHGKKGAQEWISQGIYFMGDDSVCPFCGQEIVDKSLVNAFSEYLCNDYQVFKKNLSQRINQVSLDWDIFTLSKDVVDLQKTIKKAEVLFGEAINAWDADLENLYQEILTNEQSFLDEFNILRETANTALKSKIALCNVDVELSADILEKIKKCYDEKIDEISGIVSKVNEAVLLVKTEINSNSYEDKNAEFISQLQDINRKIVRLNEDNDCIDWKAQYDLIEEKSWQVKEKSDELESDQSEYLNCIF